MPTHLHCHPGRQAAADAFGAGAERQAERRLVAHVRGQQLAAQLAQQGLGGVQGGTSAVWAHGHAAARHPGSVDSRDARHRHAGYAHRRARAPALAAQQAGRTCCRLETATALPSLPSAGTTSSCPSRSGASRRCSRAAGPRRARSAPAAAAAPPSPADAYSAAAREEESSAPTTASAWRSSSARNTSASSSLVSRLGCVGGWVGEAGWFWPGVGARGQQGHASWCCVLGGRHAEGCAGLGAAAGSWSAPPGGASDAQLVSDHEKDLAVGGPPAAQRVPRVGGQEAQAAVDGQDERLAPRQRGAQALLPLRHQALDQRREEGAPWGRAGGWGGWEGLRHGGGQASKATRCWCLAYTAGPEGARNGASAARATRHSMAVCTCQQRVHFLQLFISGQL